MRLCETEEAARLCALDGEQGLFIWNADGSLNHIDMSVPPIFHRFKPWAKLYDQDAARLKSTIIALGVSVVKFRDRGTPNQHVALCARPVDRALRYVGGESLDVLYAEALALKESHAAEKRRADSTYRGRLHAERSEHPRRR